MVEDLRFGCRQIRRAPYVALAAVLILAVGIGAVTLIVGIANCFLSPFPYRDAARLVTFRVHVAEEAGVRGYDGVSEFTVPEFRDLRSGAASFEQIIGFSRTGLVYRTDAGAQQEQGAWVTTDAFRFLGVDPLLGRTLVAGDGRPGVPPACLISYAFWREQFHGDPGAPGATLVLNGELYTVAGVMPPRFQFLGASIWLPYSLENPLPNRPRYLQAIGRIRQGTKIESAAADFDTSLHRLAAAYPRDFPGKRFKGSLQTLVDAAVGNLRSLLYTLIAAVTLLLLIACGNVGNLLLSRAAEREREVAIRASLGATRIRIVRQLLVESGILALAGGAAGCWLAALGLRAVEWLLPPGTVPREALFELSRTTLLIALTITAATVLLCGLAPALHTTRRMLVPGAFGATRKARLRNSLVVLEVSLALVLLAGAGLTMRTFVALLHVDLGFDPANTLRARLVVPRLNYSSEAQQKDFLRRALHSIEALPGVKSAAFTMEDPGVNGGPEVSVDVSPAAQSGANKTMVQYCSEEYFRAMGRSLRSGRGFVAGDMGSPRQVAVVNETFARSYIAGRDAAGAKVRFHFEGMMGAPPNPEFEVVGVVADARNNGLRQPVAPQVYLPISATPVVVVKTATQPLALVGAITRQVWAVDPAAALTGMETVEQSLEKSSYAQPRFALVSLAVFAAIGLLLAVAGVFSVMAAGTAARTREIGVRMALGARPRQIAGMILADGFRLVGIGVAIGIAVTLALSRFIAHQLWGVRPADPSTYAAVSVILAASGLAACYLPARRAARIAPTEALRHLE